MVLVQKWPFFQLFFFQAIQARKNCFTTFQNEKTPLQAIKTRTSRSRRIAIFPKGLTYGFGTKIAIFFNLFTLGNIGHKNDFYGILERKNAFLGYKNKKLKRSKNCHFSKEVNPWFWSKNGHFFNFFQGGGGGNWQGKYLLRDYRTKRHLSRL